MAISISPNEWRIMELLWQSPLTLMELVRLSTMQEAVSTWLV